MIDARPRGPGSDAPPGGPAVSFAGTIVIVNFNSGAYLSACLDSIAAHAPDAQAVVVDNCSTDGSERAAEGRSGVTLLRNAENVGFAKGVNQALASTSALLALLLNPDCRLGPDSLNPLESELREHPECAIAGPRILNDDGTVQGSARGDPDLLTGLFGRTTLLTRLLPGTRLAKRNVRLDIQQMKSGVSVDVDWVSGACMLARRRALEAVGGFDEGYFLYWEDADLCRRLRDAGHSIRYVSAATVVHAVGRSSRTARSLAITAFHQSAYRYYATHVARSQVQRWAAWLALMARCRVKILQDRFLPSS